MKSTLPLLARDVAAIFLAPPSSPSLRHSIATIFVYLVLNFKINTAQDVRRDSTYLLRPERSKFQVSVPVKAQVPIVKQHLRKKKFLFSLISYYPNATSRFQINRISISGDVAINPGPQTAASNTTKDKCSICSRTVASNHRAIECELLTMVPYKMWFNYSSQIPTNDQFGKSFLALPEVYVTAADL